MKEQNTVTKIECERRRKKLSLNIKAHRKVCPTFTYYVKVDDLLTEKAGGVRWEGGEGGHPKPTISCVRKGKSTFKATAYTRLLVPV